jgi:Ser/Thr protein kinase RdoA (MazF antagonist)
MPEPVPSLLDFCRDTLGSISSSRFCGWDHGESLVWELRSAAGERAFLKSHRQEVKFRQERRAYRQWCAALAGSVPQLLAEREAEPRALLFSALPGVPLETLQPETHVELDAHHQAGSLLARLHAQVTPDAAPDPADAFAARLETWSARARSVIDADVIDWVSGRVHEALPLLHGLQRVPCHRDYTPRNWLWNGDRLTVIDFEHSRPDLWFLDLERLWTGLWPARPDLRHAFLAGYGRELSENEEGLLERLAALGALTTIVWAREHADAAFEQAGWRSLARLRNESHHAQSGTGS